MQKKFCLIVPCYNEEKRLHLDAWHRGDTMFLFVDDGSKDRTFDLLQNSKDTNHQILKLSQNLGKAEAVRLGMICALHNPITAEIDWFGYWDADLATPLSEIDGFDFFSNFYPSAKSIWGSRIYRCGSKIERHLRRHILGRLFATVAKTLLKLETYDSQCGAKLFHRSIVEPVFSKPFISRWIFDVEIYIRLEQLNALIVEYPLRQWTDISNGTMRICATSLRVLKDIWNIKSAYRR
jgi:dolichyl-phosphate beta-glucosyltransferase